MGGAGLFLVAIGAIFLYGGMTDKSPLKIFQELLAGGQMQDVKPRHKNHIGPLVPA